MRGGPAYDGGTTALGAVRLGSTPSGPTILNKKGFRKEASFFNIV